MDTFSNVELYWRFLIALGIVLGLIGVIAWGGRWANQRGFGAFKGRSQKRLSLIDVLPLDSKHKLLLVRRDDQEHLLCLGQGTPLVVENVKALCEKESSDHIYQVLQKDASLKMVKSQ